MQVVSKFVFFFQICLGSASEGVLHVGDQIASINGLDATRLSHADAQNVFKNAGVSITLGVVRPTSYFDQGKSL